MRALKGGTQMDKNTCAETDEDACANPCRFPANLSLEPDDAAAQCGNADPDPELRRHSIHLISPKRCFPLLRRKSKAFHSHTAGLRKQGQDNSIFSYRQMYLYSSIV